MSGSWALFHAADALAFGNAVPGWAFLRKPASIDRVLGRFPNGYLDDLSDKETIGIGDLRVVDKEVAHTDAVLSSHTRERVSRTDAVGDHGTGLPDLSARSQSYRKAVPRNTEHWKDLILRNDANTIEAAFDTGSHEGIGERCGVVSSSDGIDEGPVF